ncbi:MAG: hypothetical protein OXC14_17195 [Rhodospirillaceae bacterium]|nr:hypothetical protein [Rhodospirillaceae bacterium]
MAKQENPSTFPDALILNEGFFAAPRGGLVNTIYVDLSGTLPLGNLSLTKASEPRFALSTTDSIRLSRPGVFRDTGEVLVKDEQEGMVRRETRKTDQIGTQDSTQMERRVQALNAAIRLADVKISLKGTQEREKTNTQNESMTFGKDWLIFCASISPADNEEEAWRRTFPASYTRDSHIYRPSQFAQALGVGICEQIGASGEPAPLRGVFEGFRSVETIKTPQLVLHGPVLYVDEPYGFITETDKGWPRICSMIFVKSRAYAAQKEYRFAAISIPPEVGDVFDLRVSGMLRDCLEPVKPAVPAMSGTVKISTDVPPGGTEQETFRGYTYQRKTVRRESTTDGSGEPTASSTKEDIVEETVTSPDELPGPFPSDKRPDVIIAHQIGGTVSLVHEAYRDVETRRWRFETRRATPGIVADCNLHTLAGSLRIPPDLRFASPAEPPLHPEYLLDLCLNPSVPRPPASFEGLERCNESEIKHALACWQALRGAVEQVPDGLREMAAASAWYAFLFIQDVVSLFGSVIKNVCVIRECVAVVQLEPAPFSGAAAWATFSGAGAYLIHVHCRNVEEITYSGHTRRAGPISNHTCIQALQKHGWVLKHDRSKKHT